MCCIALTYNSLIIIPEKIHGLYLREQTQKSLQMKSRSCTIVQSTGRKRLRTPKHYLKCSCKLCSFFFSDASLLCSVSVLQEKNVDEN